VVGETATKTVRSQARTASDFKALARGIAVEAGKYLAKDGSEGVKKKLTRSGSVKRFCSRCDALMRQGDVDRDAPVPVM